MAGVQRIAAPSSSSGASVDLWRGPPTALSRGRSLDASTGPTSDASRVSGDREEKLDRRCEEAGREVVDVRRERLLEPPARPGCQQPLPEPASTEPLPEPLLEPRCWRSRPWWWSWPPVRFAEIAVAAAGPVPEPLERRPPLRPPRNREPDSSDTEVTEPTGDGEALAGGQLRSSGWPACRPWSWSA